MIVNKKATKYLINEEIPFKRVLLVRDDNSSEELSISDAIQKAKDENQDLILINDKAQVPIVKILEHGKFIYSQKRKTKNNKKNLVKTKSITVKPKIDSHDLHWKANQAISWFKMGDRVQFIVRAGGRISARTDLIFSVFNKFTELVAEFGESKGELKQSSKIQFETHFFPLSKTSPKKAPNASTTEENASTEEDSTSASPTKEPNKVPAAESSKPKEN